MSTGFDFHSTAEDVTAGLDLTGRTFLVTGATSGLGAETARVLALRGARVIATGRTADKARAHGIGVACELSDLDSVRRCVEEVRGMGPIDAIVANAGVMALQERQERYGVEMQLLTNHVGHALLVTGLLDRLTPDGRVVMVSSAAHRMAPEDGVELDNVDGSRGYHPWRHYGQSKLANILFARALSRRLPAGQTANALHPGVIETNLQRHVPDPAGLMARMDPKIIKNIGQGAATQTYLAAHPGAAAYNGTYFSDVNPAKTTEAGTDDALGERLWSWTMSLLETV